MKVIVKTLVSGFLAAAAVVTQAQAKYDDFPLYTTLCADAAKRAVIEAFHSNDTSLMPHKEVYASQSTMFMKLWESMDCAAEPENVKYMQELYREKLYPASAPH